jgi:hypothetical protein
MKVVYIMGAGRSGSTVLDVVLSNHAAIEGIGELMRLTGHGIADNEYCACGARESDCPFWSEVIQRWQDDAGLGGIHEYSALQDKVERLLAQAAPGRARQHHSDDLARYAHQTCALFEAIGSVSRKDIIVDSSKNRARALALANVKGLDVYLIHLVRDVRGVVWSLKKHFARNEKAGIPSEIQSLPVWRASAQWCYVNLESEWVRRQVPPERSMRLRYEDFVSDPGATLIRIGRFIETDLTQLADAVADGALLRVNHTIAGNRLRMKGAIKLSLDQEWTCKLEKKEKRIVNTIAGALMYRYGYYSGLQSIEPSASH